MRKQEIIDKVNKQYTARKLSKHPNISPDKLPKEIQSDQVKCVIDIFAEILEQLTEKKTKNFIIDLETEKDRNGFL